MNERITVGLRSGRTVKFTCKTFTLTRTNGVITGYEYEGIKGGHVAFLVSEIEYVRWK